LASDLAKLQYGSYRFQVVHNVDAEPRFDNSAVFDALTRQVSSPVLWSQSIETLIRHGVEAFVEVGPGKVLGGLVRQIDRNVRTFNVSDAESLRSTIESIWTGEDMSEVQDKIKQIIVDELGVDEAEVTENARFIEDLGADSLDLVELVMRFEEEFDIEIPDEDAEKIQSVRDAYAYVEQHQK